MRAPSPPSPWPRERRWWLAGAMVLVGLLAYLPILHNGFVWDDDAFLTINPLIKAPDGPLRLWFSTQPSDYWPVTSTTLWIEWRLWGMNPLGYHVTNLILHLTEGLMLWSVLQRLKVPGAYLAALLFVVHPVNVESVAWIAQRKNLMAMLFYLASVYFFIRALEAGSGDLARLGEQGPPLPIDRWYWLSLLTFILAMLSKGSVAPLPVVLLGIIAWRRRITSRDVALLAPFFLVAAVLIGVNVWFQTHGSGEIVRQANGLERLLGAGAVVWFYLYKALLPVGLIFVYPQWQISAGSFLWWLPLLAVSGLTVALWRSARFPSGRAAFFAWAYFVAMLLPVMGFADVYFMKYSLVADHYQHLAIIGVLAFAAAVWARFAGDSRLKFAIAAAAVGFLAVETYRDTGVFRDNRTLWSATVRGNPGSWMAQNNLGRSLLLQGQTDEAADHLQRALAINPGDGPAHYNFGLVLARQGRHPEAMAEYEKALRLQPKFPDAQNGLANELLRQGRPVDAIFWFEKALSLDPDNAEAHANLGAALAATGKSGEAIAQYELALKQRPDFAEACNDLGVALAAAKRIPEAIPAYERALRLKPNYFEAQINLGNALANSGRPAEAAEHFKEALLINPDYAPARQNLARLQAMLPSSP